MSRWAVVVPSNRPEQLEKFKLVWDDLFSIHNVNLIVVKDEPDTWKSLPEFIPRRTDMIRSWGFYLAYQTDCDYILTLDDDTTPLGDIFKEYEKVFERGAPFSEYLSVGALTSSGLEMRGFPYKDRKPASVGVQYGGWNNVLDYDAPTQLSVPRKAEKFRDIVLSVPKGVPTTCCIMNCAFRREMVPIMWQLPLIDGKYNRFGDIWSGLFIKKTLDTVGWVMVINGKASIWHDRASNPFNNLEREQPGIEPNENIWANLYVYSNELIGAYKDITDSFTAYISRFDSDYADKFRESRNSWLRLFQEDFGRK